MKIGRFALALLVAILCVFPALLAAIPNAHASYRYLATLEVVSGPTLSPNALVYSPTGDITAEIVDCGLGGVPADFPPSVSGRIALISRGTYTFYVKTLNAQNAGAVAAIIYNNVAGNFVGTLGQVTGIPAISVSDVEGASLLTMLGLGPVAVHLTVGPELTEPLIESVDLNGGLKNTFLAFEEVYVTGDYFAPSAASFDIYVVDDVPTWVDGMAIPSRVPGTAVSVSSSSDGSVSTTLVWSAPLAVGMYDIVVDVDGDGVYDKGKDALDDNDIRVTAGFNVIPEVPMGTIMASALMIVALIGYFAVPKWKTRRPRIS